MKQPVLLHLHDSSASLCLPEQQVGEAVPGGIFIYRVCPSRGLDGGSGLDTPRLRGGEYRVFPPPAMGRRRGGPRTAGS